MMPRLRMCAYLLDSKAKEPRYRPGRISSTSSAAALPQAPIMSCMQRGQGVGFMGCGIAHCSICGLFSGLEIPDSAQQHRRLTPPMRG